MSIFSEISDVLDLGKNKLASDLTKGIPSFNYKGEDSTIDKFGTPGNRSGLRPLPGNSNIQFRVEDGDSLYIVSPEYPQGKETRLSYVDAQEVAKYEKIDPKLDTEENYKLDANGNKILRPSDPYANIQARILEKILDNAINIGAKIEMPQQGIDAISGRPVHRIIIKKDGAEFDVTEYLVASGTTALHNIQWQKQPDSSIGASLQTLAKLGGKARDNKLGIYDTLRSFDILMSEVKKEEPPRKLVVNSRMNQKNYDLNDKKNKNKVKIGDVWLNIPPTHLLISQLRSSYNVQILGNESKPINNSITNRIIIKINLIFHGSDLINEDLRRLLIQFKYCPINIIKSRDLFEKLSSENTWLKNAYGNTGTYAVPVTMDNIVLYTIEGHENTVGCSLQLSLFNFAPYYLNNPNERMEYYKFDETFYEEVGKKANAVSLKKKIEVSHKNKLEKIFNTTINLEDSVHPYNFIVEQELSNQLINWTNNKNGNNSAISIAKIDKTKSLKEYRLTEGDKIPTPEDLMSIISGSVITDIANSISISMSNNFGWQPLVGYSQPIAQYLGPGETSVAINIKTNNQDNISKILKSYNEILESNQYGFYDDRMMVTTHLLDITRNNILSLQNVNISSIEGKPEWSDINLTFNKSSYEYLLAEGESPFEKDDYWGLGRIMKALTGEQIEDAIINAEKARAANSLVHTLHNPSNIDLSKDGINDWFLIGLNRQLEFLYGLQVGSVIGSNIISRIEIISSSRGVLEDSVVKNRKLLEEATKRDLASGKTPGEWWTYPEFTSKILLENGKTFDQLSESRNGFWSDESEKGRIRKKIAKILKSRSSDYMAVSNKSVISFKIQANGDNELDIIKKIFTGQASEFNSFTSAKEKRLPQYLYKPFLKKDGAIYVTIEGRNINTITYTQEEKNYIADIERESNDKIKQLLKISNDQKLFQSKPKAAHRYIPDIDEWITYSNMFSKTMGYWFACDRLNRAKNYQAKLSEIQKDCIDPIKRTEAFALVFEKQVPIPEVAKAIRDNSDNPLSVPSAILHNKFVREGSATEIGKGIIDVKDETKNSDDNYPFTSFSDLILNQDYFGMNSIMAEKVMDYINKESQQQYYFAEMNRDQIDYVSKIYNKNSLLGFIVPQRNSVQLASEITPGSLTGIGTTNPLVDTKLPTNRPATTNLQVMNAAFSKDNSNVTLPVLSNITTETRQNISFVNYAGSNSKAKTIKERVKLDQKKALDHVLNSYLLSQQPTVALENAFPSYKLYIIHDDTSDYKYSSLDDYWDFRLVQDIMVVRDKNNPAHLLKCRLIVDPRYTTTNPRVNQRLGADKPVEFKLNITEGIDTEKEYVFMQGRAPLRQGMRICLKIGYHTDPRMMDTAFIGTITSLSGKQEIGIYELEAQGDGRELTVPPTIQNQTLTGKNFQDIIAIMLRTNPNIIHFGKVYGSWLERLSRRHRVIFSHIKNIGIGAGLIGGGGIVGGGLSLLKPNILTKSALATSVGLGIFHLASTVGKSFIEENNHQLLKEDLGTRANLWIEDMLGRFSGNIFNNNQASYQIAKHFYSTIESGNNPIDDNIWAVDIWTGQNEVSLQVNNQNSIWDILQNIKRLYPNFALDVRPYGSRSTLFLGPQDFWYWRTDDPLLAMAPSLIQMDRLNDVTKFSDAIRDGIKKLGPERNERNDITLEALAKGGGIAPFIPFTKVHAVTSEDDIIFNGIKGTPNRGWNSVVITWGEGNDPIEFVADTDIYPGAIRRKYEDVKWTTNERLVKQYALGLLKEGVERLYGGVLIIKGNSRIEPYDRIFIADKINKMYGTVQVETVIHKFDSEMGYTTHIVPNMICAINNSSYLSYSDILRREVCNRVSNLFTPDGFWDLANITAGALSVFVPGGFLVSALVSIATSTAIALAKGYFQNKNIKEKAKFDRIYDEDPNNLMWMQLLRTSHDITIFQAEQVFAQSVTYFLKLLWKGKNNGFEDIKKIKITKDMASRMAEAATSSLEHSKNMAKGSYEFVKLFGASRTLNKMQKLFDITDEELDDLIKNNSKAFDDAWEGLEKEGKTPKGFKSAEDFKKAYISNKDNIKSIRASFGSAKESATGKVSNFFKSESMAKWAGRAAGVFGIITAQSLPLLFDTLVIKSATGHQCIMINPLWSRDSLLMPGLDGYKNNDTYMHFKDSIIAAKQTISEAIDEFKQSDTITFFRENLLNGSSGTALAHASVPNVTDARINKPLYMSKGRIDENLSNIKAIIKKELFKNNVGPKLKTESVVNAFIDAGKKNEIDPLLLVSIALVETEYGRSYSLNTRNNIGGLTAKPNNNEWNQKRGIVRIDSSQGNGMEGTKYYAVYARVEDAIYDMASRINNWLDNGSIQNNIYSLNNKYAEDMNWKYNVSNIYTRLQQGKS